MMTIKHKTLWGMFPTCLTIAFNGNILFLKRLSHRFFFFTLLILQLESPQIVFRHHQKFLQLFYLHQFFWAVPPSPETQPWAWYHYYTSQTFYGESPDCHRHVLIQQPHGTNIFLCICLRRIRRTGQILCHSKKFIIQKSTNHFKKQILHHFFCQTCIPSVQIFLVSREPIDEEVCFSRSIHGILLKPIKSLKFCFKMIKI